MGERSREAGSLSNPMLTYRGMDSTSGGQWPDTEEKRLEIEQAFPWPGKRGLKQTMASKDAEAVQSEVRVLALDVELSAAEAFYALHAARQSVALIRDEAALLRRIESLAAVRYTTGAVGQQDVLKAQTEITLLKQKTIELEARERTLVNKLNTLMNQPAATAMGPLAVPLFKALSAVEDGQGVGKALAGRPELQLAQARMERAQAEQAYMKKEGLPDYKLGFEYRSLPADDQAMFMVGIELPIWRSKVRAGVRGAGYMVQSERAAREAVERQVTQEVQDAWVQVQAAQRILALTRAELIPQAQGRLSASEAAYRSGDKGDFMDLLESERFLLNVRVAAVVAEAELGMQWSRYARAMGLSVLEVLK